MGPRVYNLFPTLAGAMAQWPGHFDRIAAMGFDWVFLNPIHAVGGSGSLYAVADYYRLNPLLRGSDARPEADIVREMVAAARARGLAVMLDLVINHTAADSPLVSERSLWYVRDDAGNLVAPHAVDPDEPEKITVWGDLAELDFSERPVRAEMIAFFSEVVAHYLGLGVRGFRCDAAYKVPGSVWEEVISAARRVDSQALFAAETLGCRPEEVEQLGDAGFDYLFNSSKWWDFRSEWLFEQYESYRHIAPSIAFPESHDTPRLAAEFAGQSPLELEAEYRFRYLFAAFFSSGVMMPVGYEFGFARKLDVVTTRPADWEQPRFDLRSFIADVNAMKAAMPLLNEEGAERLIAPHRDDAIALLRSGSTRRDGVVVALLNPRRDANATIDSASLLAAIDGLPLEITRRGETTTRTLSYDRRIQLRPLEIRIFATPQNGATPSYPIVDARPVAIENVTPQIDGGRFAVKRIIGERVDVEADVFREGHDAVSAVLLHREAGAERWRETPFELIENDRFGGSFRVARATTYEFTLEAWPDAFATWQHDAALKKAAGLALTVEIREGLELLAAARERAWGASRSELATVIGKIESLANDDARATEMLAESVAALAARAPDRTQATRTPRYRVDVDRPQAQFAAW